VRSIPKEESTWPVKPYLATTARRLHGLILDHLETGAVLAGGVEATEVDEGQADPVEAPVVAVPAVPTADVSRVEIAN